ncbi:MAG: tyrosine-type recombinase/integrase [Candidatus Saccharibacteria bacterium]|nr:tyrosine-type recombinase/integrase [Microbacteriaceae bacterium]
MTAIRTTQPLRPALTPSQTAELAGLTVHDAALIAAAMDAELADSTRVQYASAWRQWERWCLTRGVTALSAPPEAIAAFLVGRAETGLTYGSIEIGCSAIKYHYQRHGLPDPMADAMIRRVRRGLRRILGVAPRVRSHALTVEQIGQMVSAIDTTTATSIRARAIILLGFASAVRPSELAALDLTDITALPSGILMTIRRSKTDPTGRGQLVGVVRGDHPHTDPVAALAVWTACRPVGPGPLFTRIHRTGVVTAIGLDVRTISRTITSRATSAGLDALPVFGHSLRAGHATTAAANGASIDRIAAQTRHRDLDTLIEHYIRPATALSTSTSADLGL